jgi:hypothetical protein
LTSRTFLTVWSFVLPLYLPCLRPFLPSRLVCTHGRHHISNVRAPWYTPLTAASFSGAASVSSLSVADHDSEKRRIPLGERR